MAGPLGGKFKDKMKQTRDDAVDKAKTISDIDFINGLDQIIDEINDYIDGIDYYQNQQDLQDLINNSEEVN